MTWAGPQQVYIFNIGASLVLLYSLHFHLQFLAQNLFLSHKVLDSSFNLRLFSAKTPALFALAVSSLFLKSTLYPPLHFLFTLYRRLEPGWDLRLEFDRKPLLPQKCFPVVQNVPLYLVPNCLNETLVVIEGRHHLGEVLVAV